MAHKWTYKKDGGEKYPVRPSQTWKVGNHVFVCSDLVETRNFDAVLQRLRVNPTVIYADPPWTPSQLTGFRTKAALDAARYTITQLYERIYGLFPDVPHYVERGIKEIPGLAIPGPHKVTWDTTHYRKNPAALMYSGKTPPPAGFTAEGVDDDFTPGLVLDAYPRGIVVDPCAGRGLTARTAAQKGWRSFTNELSPWRMSAAMHSVAKIVGEEPKRLAI